MLPLLFSVRARRRNARRWFSLALGLIASVHAFAAQPLTPRERFGSVTRWRLVYRFSASSPYRWAEGPLQRERTRWDASHFGTVIIVMQSPDSGDVLQGDGEGKEEASLDRYFVEHSDFFSDSRYDRGSGTTTAYAHLWIDLKTETYQLEVRDGDIPSIYGGRRMQVGQGVTNWGPTTGTTGTPMPSPLAPHGTQKLPAAGRSLHGSWSWEEYLAKQPSTDPTFDRHEWSKRSPASGTLSWILEPDEPIEEELIVTVDDYDNWLPTAGRDESVTGNTVKLNATVVAKSGGAPTHQAVKFHFELVQVSREPGIALNAPLSGAKTTPDLSFDASANPDGWIVLNDGLALERAGAKSTTATATVSSHDWGAFGVVNVSATLDNGRILQGHFKGSENPDIRLPKRDAISRIGDAWKQALEFRGGDTDDLDEQTGNTHEGDGLTAYEEYRGLIIDGRHTRQTGLLHPNKKNVLVENRLGATARGGFGLFESASGISVVELPPNTLPASRLVNINRGSASGGEQFGMTFSKGAVADGVAENRPADVLPKTPKLSQGIVIDVDQITEKFRLQSELMRQAEMPMPFTLAQTLSNTIAHEIAHGVGTPHHGKQTEYFGPHEVTVKMRDWRVVGVNGLLVVPTDQTPVVLGGSIGRPGNDSSGDTNCIMCYANNYSWAAVGPEGGPYRFIKTVVQPEGTTFCTSPAATGFNLPHPIGNKVTVPGFFGNATSVQKGLPAGNCLGAMKVRDW